MSDAVYIFDEARLTEHLLEHIQVLGMARQVLDGHPDMVPPSNLPTMALLPPVHDAEYDALDSHCPNPQCQGHLAWLIEEDQEVLRVMARGVHLVWGHADASHNHPAHVPDGDVDALGPVRHRQEHSPGVVLGGLLRHGH